MNPVQLPPYFREDAASSVRAQGMPYHLQDVHFDRHWVQTDGGAGILVGICDTGIDAAHPEFEGKQISGESFVSRRQGNGYHDGNDHGTHVAGIIAGKTVGCAPNADLFIAKVLGDNGSGSNQGVAEGIDACREAGCDIINLSLGGPYDDPATRDAIARAHAANILVFAATGNERASHVSYPAVHCIAVGAVDRALKLAYFSNTGKAVDLVGYGVDVYSSVPGGQYQRFSGTSMASPWVAGCFGCRQSAELKHLGEIRTKSPTDALQLETLVTDLGPAGRDPSHGRGFPDLNRGFYEMLDAERPQPTDELALIIQGAEYDGRLFGPATLHPLSRDAEP